MKRILCVLLIIVMCVSVVACDNANNEDVGKKYLSGDPIRHKVFSYSINPDGKTCTITGFDWENPSTRIYSYIPQWAINVDIPNKIHGYTVTEIAPNAFENEVQIQTVIIPSTLTKIGENAFANCTMLTSATFESPENWGEFTNIFSNPESAAEYLVYSTETIHFN